MKYYVILADDNKTITAVYQDNVDGTIEIDTDKPIEDLAFGGYEYVNGELIENEQKHNELKMNEIRVLRDEICFPIINRGELWYNTLADWQIEELNNWYRAWLDAPETKVIPEKPTWLN